MIVSGNNGATWQVSNSGGYTGYGTTYGFLNGTSTVSCKPSSGAIFSSDYAKLAIDTGAGSPFKNYVYIVADVPVVRGSGGLSGCFIQNAFIRSTDGGQTWNQHIILTPSLTDFGFIQKIAIGPNGEIYFAKPGNGGIEFFKSTDGGSTFSVANVSINLGVNIVDTAVSSGILYMAYLGAAQYPTQGACTDCSIYLTQSLDDGNTWSNPTVISEVGAVPYYGPTPNPCTICGPFGPERSTVTITTTPTRVFVAWRDWINSGNATDGDYYAYDSHYGLIRLTTYTGRFCAPPNAGDCTTFSGGSDYMGATSSGETIYIAYGIDSNNDMIPDANFVTLTN